MKIEARLEKEGEALVVLFDDTPHIWLDRTKLLGMQSWIEDEPRVDRFVIRFTLIGNRFITAYDDRARWVEVLLKIRELL